MTPDMWITVGILVVAIVLFITEWLRVDIVAIGVVIALMLTGILETSEALAGFANSAVITIAALFVIGGAVLQTGLAGILGQRILKVAGTDEIRLTAVIMIAVALLSGVMSNTGTVAVLLPAIVGLSRRANISPSKLLIPLSFGSMLGGAMTLIGTPPNIIVSDIMRQQNQLLGEEVYRPFEFFDFAPIGVLLLITGLVFTVTIGQRLLPERASKGTRDSANYDPEHLVTLYDLEESIAYLRVPSGSDVAGNSIQDTRIRRDYGVNIIEIIRQTQRRSVARFGNQRVLIESPGPGNIFPTAETEVMPEDILVIQGDKESIRNLAYNRKLDFEAAPEGLDALVNRQVGIAEILLPPQSPLVGKSLRQSRFSPTYNLTVMGINRPGTDERPNINRTTLRFGDTLLVQGMWHDIMALRKRPDDFVVLGQPETMIDDINTSKAPIAGVILIGMIVTLMFGWLPLVTTALIAALAVVLTGCLSMDDAYKSAIDWKSLILIAGMLPTATALEKVGLVGEIATLMQTSLGGADPRLVIGALFIVTAVFTQVLSNTATAVVIAPIAMETAAQLNLSPAPFLMTVAIAASMAFASPVASPTNTLVLGAGEYKFIDFVKIGVPMLILSFIVAIIAIPIFFPF
jgi:di/tricarboxylate transporter